MESKRKFGVMGIFGIIMAFTYVGFGLFILLTNTFNYVPSEVRMIFAIFLLVYGLFRFVRIFFNSKRPES